MSDAAVDFRIERIRPAHAHCLALVHRSIFPHYPSSRLGTGFCRGFYGAYGSSPEVVGYGAWQGQTVIGLVIGCPAPIQESIRRQLRCRAVRSLVLRPWLLIQRITRRAGRPHGQTVVAGRSTPSSGLIRLVNLGVIPSARKTGVARALVDAFLAECHRRGYTMVELNVDPDNAPALRFYERYGWRCDEIATPPGSASLRYVITPGRRGAGLRPPA